MYKDTMGDLEDSYCKRDKKKTDRQYLIDEQCNG